MKATEHGVANVEEDIEKHRKQWTSHTERVKASMSILPNRARPGRKWLGKQRDSKQASEA
jgi:hypothetical protein